MSNPPPLDGVLVVHKPTGPSSHDIVVVARRALGVRRIGHTGTLDPQASGVLPLVVGQATRLAQLLTGSVKEYLATVRFGLVTDTYDAAGTIVARSERVPARADLEAALEPFRGTFAQRPPAYSAKMIGGDRSYVHARAGTPLQNPPVEVTVSALVLEAYEPPCARLRLRCSAGFYVRALAHDLGEALGTGAILDELVRSEAAGFTLESALPFDLLATAPRDELWRSVRPMHDLLPDLPAAQLTAEGVEWVGHGRLLGPRQLTAMPSGPGTPVRLLSPEGRLLALARPAPGGLLHPFLVFS